MVFLLLLFIGCISKNESKKPEKLIVEEFDKMSNNSKTKYLDSVLFVAKKMEADSLQLDGFFKIAAEYYYLKNFKSSFKVSQLARQTAINLKDSASIGRSLYYMGDCFADYQKDSAYFYYKESEKIYKSINNIDRLAKVHYNKAHLLFFEGNYTESEIEVFKALNYLNYVENITYQYSCYSLQGSNHFELGEYEKSLDYFAKAAIILKKMDKDVINQKDKLYFKISNTVDICNVHDKKEEYSKSIIKLRALTKAYDLKNMPNLHHSVIGNLGYSLMKNGNYNESKRYLVQAIELTKKSKNSQGYLYKILSYGEYFLLTKDSLRSRKIFTESLTLSKKLNSGQELLTSLDFLSRVDPKNVVFYKNEYIRIKDSINKKQRENREKFARIEYETEIILDANKTLSSKNLLLLLFLSIAIVLFLIIIIVRNRISVKNELLLIQQKELANEELFNLTKKFQSELVQAKEQEQGRISKELHDGIVNQIYGVRMLLGSLNNLNDEESKQKRLFYIKELQKLETEIRMLSHELNAKKEFSSEGFLFLIQRLIDNNNELGTINFVLKSASGINFDRYSSVFKINLYRILQELLYNVNKHSEASMCRVSLKKNDSYLIVSIQDDGKGFDFNTNPIGIGISNIKERCKTINTEFSITGVLGAGTTTLLKIKVAE